MAASHLRAQFIHLHEVPGGRPSQSGGVLHEDHLALELLHGDHLAILQPRSLKLVEARHLHSTGLQSLSLQEQWEAFQIRVYDRSEGALGAIKSLIGGATMGRLRRRRKSKVSPAPLILSASPATPLPSHPFSSTPMYYNPLAYCGF